MANKTNDVYFNNYVAAAEVAVQASGYLCECIKDFKIDDIATMLIKMHEFEHAGDDLRHQMASMLAKAFVTPMEREDMAELSQNIDSVIDDIEEVLQYIYMNCVDTMTEDAVLFTDKIHECCQIMQELLIELPNFKKPIKLHELVVKLNQAEEECDSLFLNANYRYRKNLNAADKKAALNMTSWREIYSCLEACADAAEHVADAVEAIVMKNT